MITFNNKQFNYKKESNEDTNQQGLNSTCSEKGVLELNKLLDFIESRTSVSLQNFNLLLIKLLI